MNLEKLAADKGFTVGQLTPFGVRNGQGGVLVPYRDAKGNEYIRSRIIREPTPDNKSGRFWTKGDAPPIPYGLDRPVPCKRGLMWVVEGESDCWTLWLNGVPAIGIPGVQQFAKLHLSYLEEVTEIAVVREPDDAGQRFPHLIANHLYDAGFTGKIYAVALSAKDPRELWLAHGDGFLKALRADYKANREYLPPPVSATVGTRSVTLTEVFDMPAEDIPWLVNNLIPQGGIVLLSSKPKVGKSSFARNLTLSIVRGERFLGRHCDGGLVLWVALEERKEHVISAFKQLGAQRNEPIRFFFGTAPLDAMAWLQRECDAYHPSLVILDTWGKLTLLENVNDYGAVNRANEPLMRLARERGIGQLWLHHNNKSVSGNGDEVLGSTALFAAADVLLTMTRSNEGVRAVRSIQRVGSDLEETVLTIDDNGRLFSAGTRYEVALRDTKPLVLDALGDGLKTRAELLAAIEARNSLKAAAFNDLLRGGEIEVGEGSGRRGDPVRYRYHRNYRVENETAVENTSSHIPGSLKEPPELETTDLVSSPHISGTAGNYSEPRESPEPSEPRESPEPKPFSPEEAADIWQHAKDVGLL